MAKRDRTLHYTIGFGVLVVGLVLGQQWLAGSGGGPAEGKPAPDFAVKKLTGETLRLEELRGKVVLVDFWARWCDPCVEMMAPLDRLARKMAGKPFELLSVNIESVRADRIDQWLKAKGYSFAGAQDVGGKAQRTYQVSTIPRLVLIDAGGVLRKRYGTEASEARLARDIEKLLPAS